LRYQLVAVVVVTAVQAAVLVDLVEQEITLVQALRVLRVKVTLAAAVPVVEQERLELATVV
jgi:hypothetical protein